MFQTTNQYSFTYYGLTWLNHDESHPKSSQKKSPTQRRPSEADPLHPPGCPQCCPFVLKTSGGTVHVLAPENVFQKMGHVVNSHDSGTD